MSAYPEDWQPTRDGGPEPSTVAGAHGSALPDPLAVSMPPAESVPAPGSTTGAISSGPGSGDPSAGVGRARPAWVLPDAVLAAITEGGAIVAPEATEGTATVRCLGTPLLRLDPTGRPPATWSEPAFGAALVGLLTTERLIHVLAANRNAELTLHRGLRAELDIGPILRGLARGGFRAQQGGGIRVTAYRVSHPVLGDVVKLSVGRNSTHVSDMAWIAPRTTRMLRALVAIEAQARRA